MSYSTLTFERRGPVGILALNRPRVLNAINRLMVEELDAALDDIEADAETRVLILQGAGRAFCAGFDLKEEAEMEGSGVAEWKPILHRDLDVVMRFWRLGKPTIAAVHAICIAGGFNMAGACDITIAAE